MNNFTPEDLLEYHYGEMPTSRVLELEDAMKKDWTLREKLRVIHEACERLDKSIYAPSAQSVQAVLDYAAQHTEQAVTGS